MRLLFLGYLDSPLISWLKDQGENVTVSDQRFPVDDPVWDSHDFLISYGYRHLIEEDVLNKFNGNGTRTVNLHISYLPWNRGADPTFWSFIDNTPKGVTIHRLAKGLDTGDILVQQTLHFNDLNVSLLDAYRSLHEAIQVLFKQHWARLRTGEHARTPQRGHGTYHRSAERQALQSKFGIGDDTAISELITVYNKSA